MKRTDEIRTYSFDNDGLNELKSFEYGKKLASSLSNS